MMSGAQCSQQCSAPTGAQSALDPRAPLAMPQSPVKVTSNARRPSERALGSFRPEVSCKLFAQLSINLYPLIFNYD